LSINEYEEKEETAMLEIIWELLKDFLMPVLGLFSDFTWGKGLMIIAVGLAVFLCLMKVISDPNKKLLAAAVVVVGTGFGVLVFCMFMPENSEAADEGDLQVAFKEMQVWTEDEESGEICTTNPTGDLNIENISLIYIEDGTTCNYADFSDNVLLFKQLRAGSYKLSVKLENYRKKNQVFTLDADNLKDGNWTTQTVNLKSQDSMEGLELNIAMKDWSGESLKDAVVTLQIEDSKEKVKIPINAKGKSKKKVSVKKKVHIQAEVDCNGKKRAQSFTICSNSRKRNKNQTKTDTSDNLQLDMSGVLEEDYKGNELDESSGSDQSNEEDNIVVEDQKLYLTFYKLKPDQTESDQLKPDQTEEDTWRLECDEEETKRETEVQQNNPRKMLAEQEATVLDREAFGICGNIDGMLTAENPQNYFSVELEDNSYWIEFVQTYPQECDTDSWHIVVTDDADDIWLEFTASADSEKTISDIVELEAGSYHFCIESYDGESVYDIAYTLNLKNLSDTPISDETEESEEAQGYENTFFYGCISQPDDVDYYSFQLEANAAVALKFEHEELSDNETDWRVVLKNESDDILRNIAVIGNEPITISNNIGLPSGKYTIEVCAGEDYDCSEIYALSIKKCTCSYWEKEPNNVFLADEIFYNTDETEDGQSFDSDRMQDNWYYANELTNGVGIYANLSDSNDVDTFMFVCPESGSYDLICKHDIIRTDSPGLNIRVCSSSGTLVEDYQFYSDWNDAEIVNSIELIKSETYYISIESSDGCQDADYLLRIVSNHEDSTDSLSTPL